MRVWVALAAAACLAAPGATTNIRKEFAAIWSAREKDYVAAQQAAAEAEKAKSISFIETSKANVGSDALLTSFQAAMASERDLSFATAKLRLLQEFETFMAAKPSAAAAQAWMQGKIAQVQAALPAAPAEEARLSKVKIGVDEPAAQWVSEKAKAASIAGMIAGLSSELSLIDQNLRAFYTGLGQQQAEDRDRWARISASLQAAGQAMQAQAQAQAAQAPRPFHMTCNQMGVFTNCNGSR